MESDAGPTEVVLKEREWKKRPGSQKEKERLKLVQRVQGKAQTKEELQVQRLAAMGGSRFRRLQKRSHLPRKDGTGGPRYPAGPSQHGGAGIYSHLSVQLMDPLMRGSQYRKTIGKLWFNGI